MNADSIEKVYQQLGQRVAQVRDALGVTQQELAGKVGYTRASIANLEGGRQRLPLHQVAEIAQALGTTPRHLLKGIWT